MSVIDRFDPALEPETVPAFVRPAADDVDHVPDTTLPFCDNVARAVPLPRLSTAVPAHVPLTLTCEVVGAVGESLPHPTVRTASARQRK